MEFEQVAPRRAEAPDGTVVALVDRHHAQLRRPEGVWLVELAPNDDDDWFSITVYADSLLRAGGDPEPDARQRALQDVVAGLRAMRIRVRVESALNGDGGQDVVDVVDVVDMRTGSGPADADAP